MVGELGNYRSEGFSRGVRCCTRLPLSRLEQTNCQVEHLSLTDPKLTFVGGGI
jgi:hypothetical protein